jgi:hypothetical protein
MGPSHPTIHHFDGDTLIYNADTPADRAVYAGPIYGWRPDWAAPKQISLTKSAYRCFGHALAPNYFCMENVSSSGTLQFDLTAGKLSDAPHQLGRITPFRSDAMTLQYNLATTRAGDYLLWSTGGTTAAELESLFAVKFDDVAAPEKVVTVGKGITRWTLSADSKRLYYLKDYAYPAGGGEPTGTLTMAAFPGGTVETPLLPAMTKVSEPIALGQGDIDSGISYTETSRAGVPVFKVLRDPTRPETIVTVAQGVSGTLGLSVDLRFLYYYLQSDPNLRLTDGYIARADMSGPPCNLTPNETSGLYGSPFTPNGSMVLWVDNVDTASGTGEAWVGNPDGCVNKRQWTDKIDFWFLHGNDGMIFTDNTLGSTASLQYVRFPDGKSIGTPTLIQKQVGRYYAVAPDFGSVLYTIVGTGAKGGLYLYKNIALGPGGGDGGVVAGGTDGAAGADRAAGGDTGVGQ